MENILEVKKLSKKYDSFLSEYLTPKDINKIMKNIYKKWDE